MDPNQAFSMRVDDREVSSPVLAALRRHPEFRIQVERLTVGDYLIDDSLLFERKTLMDLAASIKDGRLFAQAERLASAGPRGALILEGTAKDLTESRMRREAIQGALVTLTLFFGLPLLRARDPDESARLMLFAARQQRSFARGALPRHGKRPRGKARLQSHILQGLPRIGPERAKRLIEHFGSIEAVIAADARALTEVPGIGDAVAETIRWAVREIPAGIYSATFPSWSKTMAQGAIKKVVLAYSGGLDTSVILKWLQEEYGCEVVTFTADIGQGEELEPARAKATAAGVKEIYIDDLREEFVRDFVFPMFRANAIYEGEYLLGTSIARPLIGKRLIEIAAETGADAISHGATGKGNDQVRFELTAYALNPDIKIIAPWREWDLLSREKLMDYAASRRIAVEMKRDGTKSPYSMDANLLHISYEGYDLEDPWVEPGADMWRWSVAPEDAPDQATVIELMFEHGDCVGIDGQRMSPAEVLAELNRIGGANGIGRSDIVENRYVGMKSRGCYETPGGTILLKAHRAMESLTLDREAAHLKDELMPRYASLVYNGYWFAPERLMLQAAIDATQGVVNGVVRLRLYKGNVMVVGRKSETNSLFDASIATFEEDAGAYDQKDATGFIRLNALRLRVAGRKNRP